MVPSMPSRFTQDTLTQLLLFATEAFAWTGGASSIEVGLQPWLGDFPWPRPDGGHIVGYRNRSHSNHINHRRFWFNFR